MSKTPHDISQTTFNKISFELIYTKRDYPLANEEINSIIEKHIKAAYEQVRGVNRTKLYHIFSIYLDEDKLENSHKELYHWLNELSLLHLLGSAIDNLNTSHLLNDTAMDPLGGIGSIFNYIAQKISPMLLESNRYQQPFRTITTVGVWTLNIGMITTSLMIGIIILSLALLVEYSDKFVTFLINALFNQQYNQDLKILLEPDFKAIKQSYLDSKRTSASIKNLSDEDLFVRLLDAELEAEFFKRKLAGDVTLTRESLKPWVEQSFHQKILATNPVVGFVKLHLGFFSMFHTKDMATNRFLNGLLLVLRGLTALALITGAAIIELFRYMYVGLIITSVAAAAVYLAGTLVLVNLPLYILDLYRLITDKTIEQHHSATVAEPSFQAPESESNHGPNAMRVLGNGKGFNRELEKELKNTSQVGIKTPILRVSNNQNQGDRNQEVNQSVSPKPH